MKLEGNNVHLQILLTFSQVKITFNETLTEDLTNDPLRLTSFTANLQHAVFADKPKSFNHLISL